MNTFLATKVNSILKENEILPLFNLLKANVSRSNMALTTVFIKATTFDSLGLLEEQVTELLLSTIRNTDLLFKLENDLQWGILLTQNGEEEGKAFLNRLFQLVKKDESSPSQHLNATLQGIIVEIKNDQVLYTDVVAAKNAIFNDTSEPWKIDCITKFKEQQIKTVKVSIIEENEIFKDVLQLTVEKMAVDYYNIETQTFSDGYEFLQSNWYVSGHTHIVIMNDILPRKNGVEVLHKLRNMANQKKFIIYMMTNRKSQDDMVYAYENGVDEYLLKPFDLRLFKAQLQRTFARL